MLVNLRLKHLSKMINTKSLAIWIFFPVLAATYKACLTWELGQNSLSLFCRVQNFWLQLSIKNINGKEEARCFSNGVCKVFTKNAHIWFDVLNGVVLYEKEFQDKSKVDGTWTCVQNNYALQATVNSVSGIVSDTELHIYGAQKFNDQTSVKLTCFSCRQPMNNYVEFLINGHAFDRIRFNERTKKCTNLNGLCLPGICSCSPSGNEVTRVVAITDNITVYSCRMKFVDHLNSFRVFKTSKILFDKGGFIHNGTETIITKTPTHLDGYPTSDSNEKSNMFVLVLPLICVIIFAVLLLGQSWGVDYTGSPYARKRLKEPKSRSILPKKIKNLFYDRSSPYARKGLKEPKSRSILPKKIKNLFYDRSFISTVILYSICWNKTLGIAFSEWFVFLLCVYGVVLGTNAKRKVEKLENDLKNLQTRISDLKTPIPEVNDKLTEFSSTKPPNNRCIKRRSMFRHRF